MNKKKLIIGIIMILLILIILGIIYIFKNYDGIKFKRDYESLNNTIREEDGAKYNNVSININNPIKYISAKEAINVIDNENAIIYFGTNWCPWCRNAVEVLIQSAEKYKVDTIYYVDMDKLRNIWEVKNGKLIKVQKEEDGYYDLLNRLDEVLNKDTYKIKDNDKEYDTKEKRIYMPFVIEVKNGNIVDYHTGTVDLNKKQTKYDKLTKSQKKELLNIYDKFMDDLTTTGKCNDDNTNCD